MGSASDDDMDDTHGRGGSSLQMNRLKASLEYDNVLSPDEFEASNNENGNGIEMKALVHDGSVDDDDEGLAHVHARNGGKQSNPLHSSTVKAQHGDFGATGTATSKQVAVNIFISFVGAGMLGMPYAFAQSGWLLGTCCLASASAGNMYAMLLLVNCRKRLQQEDPSRSIQGYGDLGREVMGHCGEVFVNSMVVISQLGFATAYLIFISANLFSIWKWPSAYVCFGCVPILALLVQVRDMKTLSPFSLLADVSMIFGLSAVFFEDWEFYEPHNSTIQLVQWDSFLYVTGVALYSLEGVAMVLPLEASCADRSKFPMLLIGVVTGITALMAVFGTAGYIGFGDTTVAPITLNLIGEKWATFVKLALCLALYLTYPVMMFPVSTVLEDMWCGSQPSAIFRALVVLFTACIAYMIPDFGRFLSLVGSSICVILGFILPPVCHLKVFDWRKDLRAVEIIVDVSLICFGAVFGAMGTYDSFVDIFLNGNDDGGLGR